MRSAAEAALHPASTPEAGAFFHNALYVRLHADSNPMAPTISDLSPQFCISAELRVAGYESVSRTPST